MSQSNSTTRILFVCMGNICRSPTAEGMFRHLLHSQAPELPVEVDSAGTEGYHIGQPPDGRAQAAALGRGVDLSQQRARQVVEQDYELFDYILAMDEDNLSRLRAKAPAGYSGHLGLFLQYAPDARVSEVPDPFYGGPAGFERVLDLVEAASAGLLQSLQRKR